MRNILSLLFKNKKEAKVSTPTEIMEATLKKFEGRYANNPKDKGGETYCGIARNKHPSWFGWRTIDELKVGRKLKTNADIKTFSAILANHHFLDKAVLNFYNAEYWLKLKLNDIDSVPVQTELFDTGINCGVAGAGKMLQKALNALNLDGKLYKDLEEDGVIGSKTLEAIKKTFDRDTDKVLLKALNGEQYIYYKKIITKDPEQEIFFRSWLRRVDF